MKFQNYGNANHNIDLEIKSFSSLFFQERQKRETAIASKAKPSSAKPPHFNKIKSNLAIPPCIIQKPDPFDKNLCDCSPDADNACGMIIFF